MTTTGPAALQIGDRRIPVVLPNRRDPRLHTAGVILTVHAIGLVALSFEVSLPQIVVAIVTAGFIDVAVTLGRTGRLVWPASGMLTGSGVALILRHVETGSGDLWSWEGWHWFALVAGFSVLSKYLIRFRGEHVFNPSNIGLVVAFLVVGSTVIEPLDFWWAPLGGWMGLAYAVIIGGGILITRGLRLLEMATVYWVVLVAGLAVLAASGHCMVATWSPAPVCGGEFWATLATSPEILIFVFFMMTDPKTIPEGRTARVAFAASLAALTTLMIAPHSLEYGAKVGLLAGLALLSPVRSMFDRAFPATSADDTGWQGLVSRLARPAAPAAVFGRGLILGTSLVALAGGIVLAGTPARPQALAATPREHQIDVTIGTLPDVVVHPSVEGIDMVIDDTVAAELGVMLAENLALEGEAIRYADSSRLALADGGERLSEIQARIEDAVSTGERPVDHYQFDELRLRLAGESEGQTSAALAFEATGTVGQVVYDATGAELRRSSRPLEATFLMRQLAGDRWLIVRVIES